MVSDEILITPRTPRALGFGTRLRAGQVIDWKGGGSTGHVYRVVDETGTQIAVREYFPPEIARREGDLVLAQEGCESAFQDGRKLFEEDAWQLAAQDHPGLLKVLQVWPEHGTIYFSMPWCEGHTLGEIVRASPMPPSQAQLCIWLRAMADALTLLHRRRGAHGNLSPGQVMRLDSGRLLLMEFARARRFVTRDPREIERDPFAALECGTDPRAGPVGAWTDVYALAAIMYFVLRGRAPQSAVRRAAFDAQEPLVELAGSDYGAAFLQGIDDGLALKPRARPQSLPEFLAGLGMRERRARQRAIGESLLINLPVSDAADEVPAQPVEADAMPAPTAETVPDSVASQPAEPPVLADVLIVAEPVVPEPVADATPAESPAPAAPADLREDWPTREARTDEPSAATHDGVPRREEPAVELEAEPEVKPAAKSESEPEAKPEAKSESEPQPVAWPESAWPVSEYEASAAAASYARSTQRPQPSRARTYGVVAGASAMAFLFGAWLLKVQGPREPLPMAQTVLPARPAQGQMPAAAPADAQPPQAPVAAAERGASWPIPDPLEPTAAGPLAAPPATAGPSEPIAPIGGREADAPAAPAPEPAAAAAAAAAAPAPAAAAEPPTPPAEPEASRANDTPAAEPSPPRATARPRPVPAAPAAQPRGAQTPTAASAAENVSPSNAVAPSVCPELLARQYTGPALDAAERQLLQAQCR